MDSDMVGATDFGPDMAQVKVTFTTTDNDFELPETKRQLLVPAGMWSHMKIHNENVQSHVIRADC